MQGREASPGRLGHLSRNSRDVVPSRKPEGAQLTYTQLPRPAVVQHFTARAEASSLQAALESYADERRRSRGWEGRATFKAAGPPPSFVHLERWSDFGALQRAAHAAGLFPRIARLEQLADTVHDVAVSVGRMTAAAPLCEAGCVTALSCVAEVGPALFESTVGSLLGPCVAAEGYQGSELLRSVVTPRRYTAVVWWRDEVCCRRVLGRPGEPSPLGALERVGRIEEFVRAGIPVRG